MQNASTESPKATITITEPPHDYLSTLLPKSTLAQVADDSPAVRTAEHAMKVLFRAGRLLSCRRDPQNTIERDQPWTF